MAGFEFYSSLAQKKEMTQTVFIPGSAQAVTGTQDGHIIVWDISLIMVISTIKEKKYILILFLRKISVSLKNVERLNL